MLLIQLKQGKYAFIANYMRKAAEMARKLVSDDIDVEVTALQRVKDSSKKEQVNSECIKDADYSFATVNRLAKAFYSQAGEANLLDAGYHDALQRALSGASSQGLSNDEVLRQALISSQQAFPAMLQALRGLNAATTREVAVRGPTTGQGFTFRHAAANPTAYQKAFGDI